MTAVGVVARALTVLGCVAATSGLGTPAMAAGENAPLALSRLQTIGMFVGVPVGVLLLIVLVVFAPTWVREGRYRPGLTWDAEPVWFNGPEQGSPPAMDRTGTAEPTAMVGGASAAW